MKHSPDRDNVIHVAIIDDDAEIRTLLQYMIGHSEGFQCTGSYGRCDDALAVIENDPPDVVLMDIGMPGKSGIECVGELKARFPDIQVLMLTVYSDDEKIFQSLRAGAVGYLLKKTPSDKLLAAIRDAFAGGAPMSSEVAQRVLNYFRESRPSKILASLSEREIEVLEALKEGHSYKAIAEKLFLSVHTVRFHLHNIYAKLHVSSRSEAVAKALKARAF
jgi:DNA-binding NarL/FixJ family response regulator